MMRRTTISEARSRLPEMARRLVKNPGSVEYIVHRDLPEDLALTTESHLRYLETTLAELRKKVVMPFSLAGSMQSDLSDAELEEALRELAADASVRAAEKARRLRP